MPREERRIYFDYEEIYQAIAAMCVEKDVPKPPVGHIITLDLNPANPLELELLIENHRSNVIKKFHYTKDFVVAAMMVACRNAGIPLPKGGNKGLETSSGKVILRVEIAR